MLLGKKVSKNFGGLRALRQVDFSIGKSEIVGLIGPNGSGKSTLFNVITGYLRPDEGEILLDGQDITHCRPDEIAKIGIARTFQLVRPFREMTVLRNIAVSALYGRAGESKLSDGLKLASKWAEFCGLEKRASTFASELTLAEQKRLEIARALPLEPQILLLDESLSGLNAVETAQVFELIRRVREEFGISVFMIEHIMKAVMTISDRVIVLNEGRRIAEGKPEEVARDQAVIEAYLGKTYT
jgi:branched-chain amino acid transport system ATP-binding protein